MIAGSSGRAKVTLTPLRADTGPGETTRARTSVSVTPATLKPRHAVADHDLRLRRAQPREALEVDRDAVLAAAVAVAA